MSDVASEELIDVLDENGNKTGKTLGKSEVHEKELPHGSVFIWVYNNKGEVLLQLRSKKKKIFPNVWDVSAAGHISAGERPIEAAIREVGEEIGLNVNPEELTQVEFVKDTPLLLPDKKHLEMCWVYILHQELNPKNLSIQKSELDGVRLQTIKVIQQQRKMSNSNKLYAARNPLIYDTAFREIKKILS